jgi:hypothetical protein
MHWIAASRIDEKNAMKSSVHFISIDIGIKIYKNGGRKRG